MLSELHGLDRRHPEALGTGLEEGDGVEADGFVDDDALLGEAADDGAASVPRRLDGALDLLQVALAVDPVAVGPLDGHRSILRGKGEKLITNSSCYLWLGQLAHRTDTNQFYGEMGKRIYAFLVLVGRLIGQTPIGGER